MAPIYQHISAFDQWVFADSAVRRLCVACVLGGAIGLEREFGKRPAGIRTMVFVCMACAFFTVLSPHIAGADSPNKGQVASNIVQGIGFLGAGLILRNGNRVSGLTSAAAVFAVASVGMACGAGLYLPAIFASFIIIAAMLLIGAAEQFGNIKRYPVVYEVRGGAASSLTTAAVEVLDRFRTRLRVIDSGPLGEHYRLVFHAPGNRAFHRRLLAALQKESGIEEALIYKEDEEE